MPKNPNQGGMFARYQGMNMSPVPPGFLEAAQAEGSMYANIGNAIASGITRMQDMEMKEKEFGLKQEEVKNAGLSAKAAGDKAANDSRRLDITEQENASKERERIAGERLKFMSQGLTQLDASIGDIQKQLDNAGEYKLTPERIEQLKAKRIELMDKKGKMSETYMRALDTSFAETDPNASKTPRQRYYEEWQKLPPGARLNFGEYDVTRRRQEGILPGGEPKQAEKPANPSSASGPSNGGLGAVRTGLEGYVSAGIPTAVKAYVAATTPPIANPPSNNPPTINGVASTKVENKPDYSSYHLKYDAANLPEIKLQGGGATPVSFAPTRDKTSGEINGIGLVVSPNSLGGEDPRVSAESRKKVRFAHVMKFIMDNNLAESVSPSEEERKVASAMFGTADNAPIMGRIWSAYALLNRDQTQEGVNEPQFLTLNRAFEAKFGFNIDTFIEEGKEVNQNVVEASPLPRLRQLHMEALNRQAEIAVKAREMKNMPEEFSKDPTKDERDTAIAQLEKTRKSLTLAPSGSPYYKELKDKEASLESLIRENKIRFDTWKAKYDQWEGRAKFYNELIRSESAVGEGLAVQISASRADIEFAEKAEGKLARMVGISPADRSRYGGWKAPGVVNFPRLQIKDGNLTRLVSGPEWGSWVARSGSWDQVGPVAASLERQGRIPTEEQFKALNVVQNEHDKLIPPLKGLASRFIELSKLNPIERAARQKIDADFAAAGPLRLSVMAALRVAYTGGGNPSNFEQEMLLSAIPATDEVWSVPSFALRRIRLIAVLSMLNHAKTMIQNNLGSIDDDVIDSYNQQYSAIFGRKITLEDFNNFMNVDGVVSGRNTYDGTRGQSDRGEKVQASVTSALLGLETLIDQKFK